MSIKRKSQLWISCIGVVGLASFAAGCSDSGTDADADAGAATIDAPEGISCAVDNGGCDSLVSCDDNGASIACGDCPDGYEGTGATACTDIDECTAGTSTCWASATCANEDGSFSCTCPTGAVDLNGDGSECSDEAISVAAAVNLSTENSGTRTCADGGDAVQYISVVDTVAGVTTIDLTTSPATGCLNPGDEVLVMTIQGATGNSQAGTSEFVRVSEAASSTLTLATQLANSYEGTTQFVVVQRVPNYASVTVEAAGSLTAGAFDRAAGTSGVLAFRSSGTVTVDGEITMTGLGFRGASAGIGAEGGEGRITPSGGGAGGDGGAPITCGVELTPVEGGNGVNGSGGGGSGGYEADILGGGIPIAATGGSRGGGGGGGGANSGGDNGVGGLGANSGATGTGVGGLCAGSGGGAGGASHAAASGAAPSRASMLLGAGGASGAGGGQATNALGLRAGSPGGAADTGAIGGAGGGIVYITAPTIVVGATGSVLANGNAGGDGGDGSPGTIQEQEGAGGGGGGSGGDGASGGFIYLSADALTLDASATVTSSGGAGGSGGSGGIGGNSISNGGDGGDGAAAASGANHPPAQVTPLTR